MAIDSSISKNWNFTTVPLAKQILGTLMKDRPKLRLLVAQGSFDMAHAIGAMEYNTSQFGLPRDSSPSPNIPANT